MFKNIFLLINIFISIAIKDSISQSGSTIIDSGNTVVQTTKTLLTGNNESNSTNNNSWSSNETTYIPTNKNDIATNLATNLVTGKIEATTTTPKPFGLRIQDSFSKIENVFYSLFLILNPPGTSFDQTSLNYVNKITVNSKTAADEMNYLIKNGTLNPTKNCDIGNTYYSYLERRYINSNDSDKSSWIDDDLIIKLAVCKMDCNYGPLLANNYTNDTEAFITKIISKLRPDVGATCGTVLRKYLPAKQATAANILASLNNTNGNIGALFKPSQLTGLKSDETLNILKQAKNLDQSFARVLGPKLPANTAIGDAVKVLSAAPVDIILNSNAADIVSNLGNIDLGNMDINKKSVLAKQILKNPTVDNLKSMMANGDPDMINSIPLDKLKNNANFDITSVPPANLPDAFVQDYSRTQLATKKIDDLINNKDTLKRIVGGIRPSDLKNITASSKLDGAINLLNAASSGKSLSSTQRESIYNMMIEGLSYKTNSNTSYLSTLFGGLTQSNYETSAELFVEASADHLSALVDMDNNFGYILNKLSSISTSKCLSYPYPVKVSFTKQAVKYLLRIGSKTTLVTSDLATLGSCFAPTISSDYFDKFTPSEFRNIISYFKGVNFQPNKDWITKISAKIESLVSSSSQTDLDSLVSDLGETLMYYSNVNSTTLKTLLSNYGSTISSAIKTSKNPNNDTIKSARVGAGDDDVLQSSYKKFKSAYAKSIFSSSSSRRRRQAASSALSCENLNSISPDSFSVDDLKTITKEVFKSCLSTLGSSDNSYSSDQLTALLNIAINGGSNSAYTSISAITDSEIQSFNVLLLGFTANQLSQLKMTSSNTIQVLGTLNKWSSDQLTSLIQAIKTNYNDFSTTYGSLGNLVCGLNDTDLTSKSISNSDFSSNIPSWKKLQNSVCPSLSSLYARYISVNNITLLDSGSVADMDGIAGGASIDDIKKMSSEVWLSFSSSAIKNMPTETVNKLPSNVLALTTSSQLGAFYTSPYYSSFNDTVKSLFTKLSNGENIPVTTSDTGSGTGSGSGSGSGSSDSKIIKFDLVCLISGLLMAIFNFKCENFNKKFPFFTS